MDRRRRRRGNHDRGWHHFPTPIPEFSVANRDRETYVRELLFATAYAAAERSANPAALVEGDEEDAYYSHAERLSQKWAEAEREAARADVGVAVAPTYRQT